MKFKKDSKQISFIMYINYNIVFSIVDILYFIHLILNSHFQFLKKHIFIIFFLLQL